MNTSAIVSRKKKAARKAKAAEAALSNGAVGIVKSVDRLVKQASTMKQKKRSLPVASKEFIHQVLDPNGKGATIKSGVPDGSATSSAVPEFVIDQVVNSPFSITEGGEWNCFILNLPFLRAKTILYGFDSLHNFGDVDWSKAAVLVDASESAASWQNLKGENTFDFYGMVLKGKLGALVDETATARLVSQGTTIDFSAPALQTQGFVYGVQYQFDPALVLAEVDSSPRLVNSFLWNNLDPTQIVQTYHNAYHSKAVDGIYQPLLRSDQSWQYENVVERMNYLRTSNDGGAGAQHPFILSDHYFKGWNCGACVFQGISVSAVLRVKVRSVVQTVVETGSATSAFVQPASALDEQALWIIWFLSKKMCHAYPASYNDWGWLSDLIESFVGEIPFVGRFAKAMVKPAWNWLGGTVQNLTGNPVRKDGDIWYDAQS